MIAKRHAYGGVGIHHLFSGDDFYLVGVGVQRIAFGQASDLTVIGLNQFKGPL